MFVQQPSTSFTYRVITATSGTLITKEKKKKRVCAQQLHTHTPAVSPDSWTLLCGRSPRLGHVTSPLA